tara:strand:- start:85 stop:423 length:339 start_codon:yes stop_codon:yes gene_type:complete
MNEQVESWQDKIRSLAPHVSKAEYEVLKCEADVKRLQAQLELIATAKGVKTVSAQKTYADNDDSLYQFRLKVGVAKGQLSALKIELKSLDVGFEEWRTKMVNAREERKRYGA